MNSTDYENRILDAIETITTNAINKAGYDRTIQATIVDSVNSLLGKYIVKYQDSEFEAFSNNTEIYYPSGTLVNILVPNGDFNLDKMIISAADKNQIEYTNIIEEEDKYLNTSGNCISASQEFGLCSYKEYDECVLYDRDTNENNINIDIDFIEKNITDKNNILCGAEFKTDLDLLQHKNGNYGLVFDIDFLNDSTQEIITNSFVLDINQMKGDPYSLSSFVRQYKIFKINVDNFVSIKKIYLFSKDFPFQEVAKENDIFARNFEFSLLNETDTNIQDLYDLQIQIDGKKYFDGYDADTTKMKLNAKILYKNQYVTDDNIQTYWFKENASITNTSPEYCLEGGPGWECLNDYNITDDKKYYISNNLMIITKADLLSQETIIKCVAVKKNKVIAAQSVMIPNYAAMYNLSIECSEGDTFYFDHGHPILKCLINDEEIISNNEDTYTYNWGYIDSDNIYHQLEETIEENEIYNTAKAKYDELLSRVETGLALAAASQEELDSLLTIIEKHNQRVEANTLYDLDLTKVIDQAIFKCAVIKNNNILLGTASYTVYNKKETEGEYYIDILNGTQTFHYTVNGIAPTNQSLNNPIILEPLKVMLYDNNGKIVSGDALNTCRVQWIIPKDNTLIIAKDSNEMTLNYELADNYDENKLYNNNIELNVIYKGLFLKKKTTFTFTKDGEPGTNGTDIVCKIVPNSPDDENYENNCYPMIVNGSFNFGCLNYERSENYNYYNTDKWFKVELWKDGELFFSGSDSTEDIHIDWSILRNTYNDIKEDESSIKVVYDENGYHFRDLGYKENAANIVKAEILYNNVVHYAMLPVITVKLVSLENDYAIELKKNTGFRFVKYSDDGRFPAYSNSTPFTIRVTKKINGLLEDISIINNEYAVNYEWYRHGRIFNYAIGIFANDYNFIIENDNSLNKNEKFLKPNDIYDGQNVTNALEVKILDIDNIEIGRIHIPLYLYLDRYRHSALNGWDGNSISLNEDGGIILTPQIGAGHKEADNSFTGLLMGSVREKNSDDIESGLLGYHHGERTLFLDSDTGKAIFGRAGTGQIILDPGPGINLGDSKALIYGGSYVDSVLDGSGLLIDLATPEIRFGNRKFVIDKDGKLTATEVDLTGEVKATAGSFGSGRNKIKIGENPYVEYSYIYSGDKVNIDANVSGFYIGTNGIALGAAGENAQGSAFKVSEAGELVARNASIKGNIEATSGQIGKWYINDGAIKYDDQNDFYLNNDGSVKFGKFEVSNTGNVKTEGIQIAGGQFSKGSIVLEGSNEECKNGFIVGDFDFTDDTTFTNARNCVGKDSIIARGAGSSGSFNYTKITPGNVKVSNSAGTIKLEIDTVTANNKSIKFTSSDDSSYIGIWKGSNSAYMKATGVWAASYNNGSLESKKKNIVADDGCLNQILNTDIVNFNWKFEDDGDKKHVGMIIPDEGGNYHYAEKALTHDRDAVDLYSAVMMTWKALQEMQTEIDEIKGE